MALWGNKDSKAASGTIGIGYEGNGIGSMTGVGTYFTTQAKVGNTVYADGKQYVITQIFSDTSAEVQAARNGENPIGVDDGTSYTLSEKPVFVSQSESSDTSTDSGDASAVYGVDVGEIWVGPGSITDISIIQGGSNYTEVPNVTIDAGDGGQAVAEATLSEDGVVTAITVTNNGNYSYEVVPNVYLDVPRRTIPTANVNTTAEAIGYGSHALENGDAVIYRAAGGTAIAGLTDGTTYFVNTIDVDTFKLYDTKTHAEAGGATGLKNLTGTGNNAQYFDLVDPAGVTATAKAVKGSGNDNESGFGTYTSGEQHVTHSGWVRKTVGTGGRAGRVQYETLVAMGSLSGDQADDIQFPDD